MPGARAWSSGGASDSRDGGSNKGRTSNYDAASAGGIRAESRYVFPDGSVRRRLETPEGDTKNSVHGGVPMPLVGTSRLDSADLSVSMGIKALEDDGGGSIDSNVDTSGRRRRTETDGIRGGNDGAYRGPGAAPGAAWAPGGRPPRAYVPFLNLPPANGSKARGDSSEERRRTGGSGKGFVNDGGDSPSFLPSVHASAGGRRSRLRGRPLVGVGGVPVSPGRAMLTGPGRPGTENSVASLTTSGRADNEFGRRRRSRRRFGRRVSGAGGSPAGEEGLSDGGDSVESGSTDVEFLRQRAEAKLRSLDRLEAADQARGEIVFHERMRKFTGAA